MSSSCVAKHRFASVYIFQLQSGSCVRTRCCLGIRTLAWKKLISPLWRWLLICNQWTSLILFQHLIVVKVRFPPLLKRLVSRANMVIWLSLMRVGNHFCIKEKMALTDPCELPVLISRFDVWLLPSRRLVRLKILPLTSNFSILFESISWMRVWKVFFANQKRLAWMLLFYSWSHVFCNSGHCISARIFRCKPELSSM